MMAAEPATAQAAGGTNQSESSDATHLLVELDSQDDLLQPIKNSVRIKYTCLDVGHKYLALGASTGSVYVFRRNDLKYILQLSSNDGSVSKVALSRSCNRLAVVTRESIIVVWQLNIEARRPPVKILASTTHKDETVTCLLWDDTGNRVFAGDERGWVTITNVDSKKPSGLFKLLSQVILKADSAIVQLDYCKDELLVSTLTRCHVCYTKRDGAFGACFSRPSPGEDAVVLSARPGSRIWEANSGGEVLKTHQFKKLLATPPLPVVSPKVTLPLCFRDRCSPQSLSFSRLHCIGPRFLLAVATSGLYILDLQRVQAVLWTDTKLDTSNMSIYGKDIYCLVTSDQRVHKYTLCSIAHAAAKLLRRRLLQEFLSVCLAFPACIRTKSARSHLPIHIMRDLSLLLEKNKDQNEETVTRYRDLLKEIEVRAREDSASMDNVSLASSQDSTDSGESSIVRLDSGIHVIRKRNDSENSVGGQTDFPLLPSESPELFPEMSGVFSENVVEIDTVQMEEMDFPGEAKPKMETDLMEATKEGDGFTQEISGVSAENGAEIDGLEVEGMDSSGEAQADMESDLVKANTKDGGDVLSSTEADAGSWGGASARSSEETTEGMERLEMEVDGQDGNSCNETPISSEEVTKGSSIEDGAIVSDPLKLSSDAQQSELTDDCMAVETKDRTITLEQPQLLAADDGMVEAKVRDEGVVGLDLIGINQQHSSEMRSSAQEDTSSPRQEDVCSADATLELDTGCEYLKRESLSSRLSLSAVERNKARKNPQIEEVNNSTEENTLTENKEPDVGHVDEMSNILPIIEQGHLKELYKIGKIDRKDRISVAERKVSSMEMTDGENAKDGVRNVPRCPTAEIATPGEDLENSMGENFQAYGKQLSATLGEDGITSRCVSREEGSPIPVPPQSLSESNRDLVSEDTAGEVCKGVVISSANSVLTTGDDDVKQSMQIPSPMVDNLLPAPLPILPLPVALYERQPTESVVGEDLLKNVDEHISAGTDTLLTTEGSSPPVGGIRSIKNGLLEGSVDAPQEPGDKSFKEEHADEDTSTLVGGDLSEFVDKRVSASSNTSVKGGGDESILSIQLPSSTLNNSLPDTLPNPSQQSEVGNLALHTPKSPQNLPDVEISHRKTFPATVGGCEGEEEKNHSTTHEMMTVEPSPPPSRQITVDDGFLVAGSLDTLEQLGNKPSEEEHVITEEDSLTTELFELPGDLSFQTAGVKFTKSDPCHPEMERIVFLSGETSSQLSEQVVDGIPTGRTQYESEPSHDKGKGDVESALGLTVASGQKGCSKKSKGNSESIFKSFSNKLARKRKILHRSTSSQGTADTREVGSFMEKETKDVDLKTREELTNGTEELDPGDLSSRESSRTSSVILTGVEMNGHAVSVPDDINWGINFPEKDFLLSQSQTISRSLPDSSDVDFRDGDLSWITDEPVKLEPQEKAKKLKKSKKGPRTVHIGVVRATSTKEQSSQRSSPTPTGAHPTPGSTPWIPLPSPSPPPISLFTSHHGPITSAEKSTPRDGHSKEEVEVQAKSDTEGNPASGDTKPGTKAKRGNSGGNITTDGLAKVGKSLKTVTKSLSLKLNKKSPLKRFRSSELPSSSTYEVGKVETHPYSSQLKVLEETTKMARQQLSNNSASQASEVTQETLRVWLLVLHDILNVVITEEAKLEEHHAKTSVSKPRPAPFSMSIHLDNEQTHNKSPPAAESEMHQSGAREITSAEQSAEQSSKETSAITQSSICYSDSEPCRDENVGRQSIVVELGLDPSLSGSDPVLCKMESNSSVSTDSETTGVQGSSTADGRHSSAHNYAVPPSDGVTTPSSFSDENVDLSQRHGSDHLVTSKSQQLDPTRTGAIVGSLADNQDNSVTQPEYSSTGNNEVHNHLETDHSSNADSSPSQRSSEDSPSVTLRALQSLKIPEEMFLHCSELASKCFEYGVFSRTVKVDKSAKDEGGSAGNDRLITRVHISQDGSFSDLVEKERETAVNVEVKDNHESKTTPFTSEVSEEGNDVVVRSEISNGEVRDLRILTGDTPAKLLVTDSATESLLSEPDLERGVEVPPKQGVREHSKIAATVTISQFVTGGTDVVISPATSDSGPPMTEGGTEIVLKREGEEQSDPAMTMEMEVERDRLASQFLWRFYPLLDSGMARRVIDGWGHKEESFRSLVLAEGQISTDLIWDKMKDLTTKMADEVSKQLTTLVMEKPILVLACLQRLASVSPNPVDMVDILYQCYPHIRYWEAVQLLKSTEDSHANIISYVTIVTNSIHQGSRSSFFMKELSDTSLTRCVLSAALFDRSPERAAVICTTCDRQPLPFANLAVWSHKELITTILEVPQPDECLQGLLDECRRHGYWLGVIKLLKLGGQRQAALDVVMSLSDPRLLNESTGVLPQSLVEWHQVLRFLQGNPPSPRQQGNNLCIDCRRKLATSTVGGGLRTEMVSMAANRLCDSTRTIHILPKAGIKSEELNGRSSGVTARLPKSGSDWLNKQQRGEHDQSYSNNELTNNSDEYPTGGTEVTKKVSLLIGTNSSIPNVEKSMEMYLQETKKYEHPKGTSNVMRDYARQENCENHSILGTELVRDGYPNDRSEVKVESVVTEHEVNARVKDVFQVDKENHLGEGIGVPSQLDNNIVGRTEHEYSRVEHEHPTGDDDASVSHKVLNGIPHVIVRDEIKGNEFVSEEQALTNEQMLFGHTADMKNPGKAVNGDNGSLRSEKGQTAVTRVQSPVIEKSSHVISVGFDTQGMIPRKSPQNIVEGSDISASDTEDDGSILNQDTLSDVKNTGKHSAGGFNTAADHIGKNWDETAEPTLVDNQPMGVHEHSDELSRWLITWEYAGNLLLRSVGPVSAVRILQACRIPEGALSRDFFRKCLQRATEDARQKGRVKQHRDNIARVAVHPLLHKKIEEDIMDNRTSSSLGRDGWLSISSSVGTHKMHWGREVNLSSDCKMCGWSLHSFKSGLCVYPCGHVYHKDCTPGDCCIVCCK